MKIEEYAKNALVNYEAALDSWKIKMNMVRNIVEFEKSTFCYL